MTKKRYNLTLTQETVEEFQKVAKELKMAPSVMSSVCDEAIEGVLKVFKRAQLTGKFTVTDLFTMMGEVTQQAIEEEKTDASKRKTKKNP